MYASYIGQWSRSKDLETALVAACGTQGVDDLVRLHQEFVASFPEGVRPCEMWMVCGAEEAAAGGNVAALRWLHETYPGVLDTERLARGAIKAHQLQVVRWLVDLLRAGCMPFLMSRSCEAGSMHLAVWPWESTADKRVIDHPWTASTLDDDFVESNSARRYLTLACGSGNVARSEARSEADQAQDALCRSLFPVDTPEAAEARFLYRLLPAAVGSGVVAMAEWVWATFRDTSPLVATACDAWEAGSALMMEWVCSRMDTFVMERLQWQEWVRHFGYYRKPDDAVDVLAAPRVAH
jgi:hypothetical protein